MNELVKWVDDPFDHYNFLLHLGEIMGTRILGVYTSRWLNNASMTNLWINIQHLVSIDPDKYNTDPVIKTPAALIAVRQAQAAVEEEKHQLETGSA